MMVSASILLIVISGTLALFPGTARPKTGSLQEMPTGEQMVMALVVTCITIFLEDLVFRSWIFRSKVVVPLSVASSLVFAWLHAGNYNNLSPILYPIMLSPQFVCGLIMCFVRVELGFWWSFLLHLFYDFTLFAVGGLALLGKATGTSLEPVMLLYVVVVTSLAIAILLGVFRKRGR